jgi:hypothetical protein
MKIRKNGVLRVVRPDRLERPTFWFVARRSIQLSYGRIFVSGLLAFERPQS